MICIVKRLVFIVYNFLRGALLSVNQKIYACMVYEGKALKSHKNKKSNNL